RAAARDPRGAAVRRLARPPRHPQAPRHRSASGATMSEKTADVIISCPHCRRRYKMKIDPERLQRLKTRATCGRCGKTFDAASRTAPAHRSPLRAAEPKPVASASVIETVRTEPRLPRVDAPPEPTGSATPDDMRDEMEELAREFAEAAARFTPVGI